MSTFARGAAGFLTHRDRRRRMAKAAAPKMAPIDAMEQTERHLARFVSAERARELAAEAVKQTKVTYKRRRLPA